MDELITKPLTTSIVVAGSTGTAISQFMNLLPDAVSLIAGILGILVCAISLKSHYLNTLKIKLEIKKLERKI